MVAGAIVLFIIAAGVIGIAISFIVDITKDVGPGAEGASVDSLRPRRTYTFFRVESVGIAWLIVVLTFLVAAGLIAGGIAMLVL